MSYEYNIFIRFPPVLLINFLIQVALSVSLWLDIHIFLLWFGVCRYASFWGNIAPLLTSKMSGLPARENRMFLYLITCRISLIRKAKEVALNHTFWMSFTVFVTIYLPKWNRRTKLGYLCTGNHGSGKHASIIISIIACHGQGAPAFFTPCVCTM